MLTIRKEQLAAFEREIERTRIQSCINYVRGINPAMCTHVEAAVRKCRTYGFNTERQVQRFMNLLCWLGPDFENNPEYPWADSILKNTAVEPETRIVLLTDKAIEALKAHEQDTAG